MSEPAQGEPAEVAVRRRRWLTLAEVLGVAAVVISALTLWNNFSERRSVEDERTAAAVESTRRSDAQARSRALVTLRGTAEAGGRHLMLSDPAHTVQRVEVAFPPSLKAADRESVLEPRIDADWIAAQVLALTDGGDDTVEGRLPVRIAASYWDGSEQRSDTAVYDLVFRTEGRVLAGRALQLQGVVLRERGPANGARLDTLWARELGRLAE